jgi:quinol monooxygenase YgiN
VSIVVVATIKPLPEHRDEVIAAYQEVIPQVHLEDGCELYALNQTGDRLIMVEKWASREALAAHAKGAALAAMRPKMEGKTEGAAEVIILDPVPAGDSVKGVVGAGD